MSDDKLEYELKQRSKELRQEWWRLCSVDPALIRDDVAGDTVESLTSFHKIGNDIKECILTVQSRQGRQGRGRLSQDVQAVLESTHVILGIIEAELLMRRTI